MPRERRGTHSIVRTSLRVKDRASLEWWSSHLDENGVTHGSIVERDGRSTLDLDDPEGQRLALVNDDGKGDPPTAWKQSPVPPEHQIRGLGPIVMSVPDVRRTDPVLTRVMGMQHVREYKSDDASPYGVHVYQMAGDGPHTELHVAVQPDLPFARLGAGGVHHVAFRTPSEEEYHKWHDRLNSMRVPNSGEIDRYYFRSLYFREPNGILFEIATDGPGFAVDEDPATLGGKVALPPFLEPERDAIVSHLKPIDPI
jgi:glyoxalase family protein